MPHFGEARNLPQLPHHSLNYHFYRKFYSTYNIFQQKGNIQEEFGVHRCYRNKQKILEKNEKKV